MDFKHTSVLLNESIDGLNINPNGVYVDCTLGGSGHAKQIISKLTTGFFVGIDKDIDAIEFGKETLSCFENKLLVHDDYKNISKILKQNNLNHADGILVDLGVSSHQLDIAERGFSYMQDAKLDMRMNQEQSLSAYEIINTFSEEKLAEIIRVNGEEKNWFKVARNIVKAREKKPIETTKELVEIIVNSYPEKFLHKVSHPAKKVFQAIRIAVNEELDGLDTFIDDCISLLASKGRMAIITFHSLEDRIVKNKFKQYSEGCICPKELPKCVCGNTEIIRLVNRKPIVATEDELENNKRAKSAKLRIIEKLEV